MKLNLEGSNRHMDTLMPKREGSPPYLCFFSVFCFLLSAFSLAFPCLCWGQGPARVTLEATPHKISLMVGESKILKLNERQGPVTRVELADPSIADAVVLTPWQIYINGKAPGKTSFVLRDKSGATFYVTDLEVSVDISRLKETLHKIAPEEKDISVTATNDNIVLSGTVSSTLNLSQVLAIAEPFFPKKVINLLEVGGVQQVMLEVRVSEIDRSLLRRLGFNFAALSSSGKNLGMDLLNNLTSLPLGAIPFTSLASLGVSSNIAGIFRFMSKGTPWTVFIDALKEEGLVKVLAEPTLITLSGKTASFLAGGEFPVPVPETGVGASYVTIQYKTYGVALNFTPTVLSNKKISMVVLPEVSELDYTNAVSFAGYVVPALTTRRVSTVIELGDGQSFAIAGLLSDQVRGIVDKFPVLGDIPILGALFRSTSFQKNETELVVIVTPHLVKPLDLAKQTLPTDQLIEPDDFEFYLWGNLEGKEKINSSKPSSSSDFNKGSSLEGDFGHIVPK